MATDRILIVIQTEGMASLMVLYSVFVYYLRSEAEDLLNQRKVQCLTDSTGQVTFINNINSVVDWGVRIFLEVFLKSRPRKPERFLSDSVKRYAALSNNIVKTDG